MTRARFQSRRFSEPVHTARIYIGQNVNGPDGRVLRPVSKAEARKVEQLFLRHGTGALTKTKSAGVYYNSKKRKAYPSERTQVIEIVASGATSCAKFTSRAKALGRVAAKIEHQDSVLVMTECYGRPIDGTLVAAAGAPRRLSPIKVSLSARRKPR